MFRYILKYISRTSGLYTTENGLVNATASNLLISTQPRGKYEYHACELSSDILTTSC